MCFINFFPFNFLYYFAKTAWSLDDSVRLCDWDGSYGEKI